MFNFKVMFVIVALSLISCERFPQADPKENSKSEPTEIWLVPWLMFRDTGKKPKPWNRDPGGSVRRASISFLFRGDWSCKN